MTSIRNDIHYYRVHDTVHNSALHHIPYGNRQQLINYVRYPSMNIPQNLAAFFS